MFRDCSKGVEMKKKKKSKENVQLRVKISRSFPGFSENMVNKARINVLNEARERGWTGGYRNKKNSLWAGKINRARSRVLIQNRSRFHYRQFFRDILSAVATPSLLSSPQQLDDRVFVSACLLDLLIRFEKRRRKR